LGVVFLLLLLLRIFAPDLFDFPPGFADPAYHEKYSIAGYLFLYALTSGTE
jgi:hypothetical protein